MILRRTKLLGVTFLALIVLSVWLVYGVFTKKFADYDEVTLQTSTIGLQLPQRADVKIRGVIVGEVLDFEADAEGAEVTLGLYKDKRDTIPANVSGSIVPKTLFGEKYVSLVVPSDPDDRPIEPGATIERTEVSTEVEEVLSDLYPLLRTVQPAQLNRTLTAVATALEGRGEELGENLAILDSYLKRINPEIPKLVEDLRLTAEVSQVYSDVLPEVGSILQDTVLTTGTLEDREDKLNALFDDVSSFSGVAQTFLDDNEDNLIRLGEVSEPVLRALGKYSTEFPCLLRGLVNAGKRQAEAFRGFELHIQIEVLPNQPRPYTPADDPVYADDRGPNCLHLPNPPWSQDNPVRHQPDFRDGIDEPTGKGTSRVAPAFLGAGQGYAGGPAESAVLKSLLAQGLATTPDSVDDLGPLLVAPMARGAEVSVR